MEAATLRCPGCGAPASTDLHGCSHCGARLATAACPSCFGMVFRGTAHCPHCGARAESTPRTDAKPLPCPSCDGELAPVRVGQTAVNECGGCGGLWLDNVAFEALCADQERQSSVLAFRAAAAVPAQADTRIRYRSCPECGVLMHRLNFQRMSGVIIDVCREHGAWFDADELRRIVEFIQGRGLELARGREKMLLDEEHFRLDRLRGQMLRSAASESRPPLTLERVLKAISRLI